MSTAAISGIQLYEPGALTLVARAGTPLAEVEAALLAEGQRLPFEPMDHRALLGTSGEPTIGGVAAANVSGPRRVQVGAARDFMLGVRLVDGQGEIIRNGGRVMKNVTGYDLVKLMAGSRGTLGILTEIAFKVLPASAASATLVVAAEDVAAALPVLSAALTSPFDVSGAAYDPALGALIRIEGFAESVAYRAGRLKDLLRGHDVRVERDSEAVAEIWRGIRDVLPLAEAGDDIWRVSVKPSDAPSVVERCAARNMICDWGGGLIWLAVAEGTDLRARMAGMRGHATLVRAAPRTFARFGAHHPEPAPVARLSRGLRQQFDPRGILNPGLMDAPASNGETG